MTITTELIDNGILLLGVLGMLEILHSGYIKVQGAIRDLQELTWKARSIDGSLDSILYGGRVNNRKLFRMLEEIEKNTRKGNDNEDDENGLRNLFESNK